MRRSKLTWLLMMAALTLLAAATAPAFPWQEEEATAPTETQDEQAKEQTVETILREQEQLLTGQLFSYDPQGRRDPFRNLFDTLGDRPEGPRPRGIAGMVLAEIDLSGIVKDGYDGDRAMLMGSDNKGYFLQVGESVYDGTLVAIDPRLGSVTFRQKIDDPRRIKPFRDVVKRLVPLEESADE